ncbi:germin-like protein subfamily 1 member 14 [Mercurialis annua]|uniref:germin-like protein subfamily 1 member 14 n=1 Tax=Mercurialis annua TaxID=3986 RepID=UPI00215FA298|nr:germin-like protein subfamily 1 member 14 [Mercurialis annua]
MKVDNFIFIFALLALAFSLAVAPDPAPLNDFCVAPTDLKSAEIVNGQICKDPEQVKADDFFYSGLNKAADTNNRIGVNATLLTVEEIKGLNTLGIAISRIDFAPGGVNPLHHHPRSSEIFTVLTGILFAGFVTSNPEHRLFAKILRPGDVYVFPQGLIHFQENIGKTHAVAIAGFNSQNPGVVTEANTIFGSVPPIRPEVLARSFQLKEETVTFLQNQEWVNP